jgi:hypothetical protein
MGRVVCLEEAMDWRGEVGVEDEELDVERSEEQAVQDGIPDGPDGHVKKEDTSERQAKPIKPPFLCTPDQINESFNHIKAVRYSQPIHLPGTSLLFILSCLPVLTSRLALSRCRHLVTPPPHSIPVRPHLGRNNLQASITDERDHIVCRWDESYEGKRVGSNCTFGR